VRHSATRLPLAANKHQSSPATHARPPGKSKKDQAFLVGIYAILAGITPEFTLLGIPKVRLTDLLMPFLLAACGGVSGSGKIRMPLQGLMTSILAWDFCCLFLWGQASFSPGLFYLGKRLVYCLVAYAVFCTVNNTHSWNRILRLLVFTSPILSFTVLHELSRNLQTGGVYGTQEGMRASGIIANQQTSTALYIVVISCIALGAWDAFTDRNWRIGTIASLLTGFAAIMATGSRGGLASIALCVLVTAFQNRKHGAKLLIGALSLATVAWIFTPGELQDRLANIFPETSATIDHFVFGGPEIVYGGSSVADRALTAQVAFQHLIPEAGLFGLGAAFKVLGAIDDFYLTEWVYHGLIGLLMFVYLQAALVKGCWKIAQQAQDPAERGVARSAVTAVIIMSASGIHADTFYLIRPMEALALLLGLVAARQRLSQGDFTKSVKVQHRPSLIRERQRT